MLKVDHAGENGAVHIYAGQIFLARLTAPGLVAELAGYKADEERHRSVFWAELQRRGRPQCKSYWLCGIGGFALGLVTGAFGRRAIAATTVAVERVVLGHLRRQIDALREKDDEAARTIESIVLDEQQHHDDSAAHVTDDSLWSRVLSPVVQSATEVVIWIGMRA
ncbi:demethoxyubiquinone hydroxylase family protein [Janthinobacterium lividum]|uniref:demethoxyubiquinone hydroxylase family protein n=1 Tax=Janthinobacterium lividum TaxID=29581 RepID=UPI0014099F21|nr:demethoxyubiquinone hydroxylase family protein [Janthinobacterium lividum]NHQ92377.1 demethoxyubiquinone hydroxylase family protein [Janthinobacterium lividum]